MATGDRENVSTATAGDNASSHILVSYIGWSGQKREFTLCLQNKTQVWVFHIWALISSATESLRWLFTVCRWSKHEWMEVTSLCAHSWTFRQRGSVQSVVPWRVDTSPLKSDARDLGPWLENFWLFETMLE
jgi:hypothetical protein